MSKSTHKNNTNVVIVDFSTSKTTKVYCSDAQNWDFEGIKQQKSDIKQKNTKKIKKNH